MQHFPLGFNLWYTQVLVWVLYIKPQFLVPTGLVALLIHSESNKARFYNILEATKKEWTLTYSH